MTRVWLLTALLFCSAGVAEADVPPAFPPNGILDGSIKALERVPTQNLTVVETDEMSSLVMMTDNGRFVVIGKIFDSWSMKELKTVADVRAASGRLDFSRFNLDMSELEPLRIGSGPKRVQVFVDPKCPFCHKLMSKMRLLGGDYTFEVMVIATLGQESQRLARLLSCASDKAQATDQLLSGRYSDDLAQLPNCNMAPVQKRLVTAQIIGVKGVPWTISHDGRILRGYTEDLGAWLGKDAP